jgi:hypothetical protein
MVQRKRFEGAAFWPEEKGVEVSGVILEREFGGSLKSTNDGQRGI